MLSGGWKIDDISFSEPWARGGISCNPEDKILKGFEKCFSQEIEQNIRERIFRSLEWFRMAHIEDNGVSIVSKLVMMATGFETLLKFPRNGKRNYFVEYIEDKVATDEFIKGDRTDWEGKNYSLAGWWAWDFYELRNRIVHGDIISSNDLIYKEWIGHLNVADLVFWECIQQELLTNKLVGDDIYPDETNIDKKLDELFPDEPQERTVRTLTKCFLGFQEVHKALSWIA